MKELTRAEEVAKANRWFRKNQPEVVAVLKTILKSQKKRAEKPVEPEKKK